MINHHLLSSNDVGELLGGDKCKIDGTAREKKGKRGGRVFLSRDDGEGRLQNSVWGRPAVYFVIDLGAGYSLTREIKVGSGLEYKLKCGQ